MGRIIISTVFIFCLLLIGIGILTTIMHTATPPIPTPTQAIPTPISEDPAVINAERGETNLLNNFENRQPLTISDATAKNTIITSLNNQPGSPEKTDTYRIDYLPSADLFQVEITTTDYAKAKQDATAWFISQGFTQDGLCKLPVMFYLNWNIKQQVQQASDTFNPLPDGC